MLISEEDSKIIEHESCSHLSDHRRIPVCLCVCVCVCVCVRACVHACVCVCVIHTLHNQRQSSVILCLYVLCYISPITVILNHWMACCCLCNNNKPLTCYYHKRTWHGSWDLGCGCLVDKVKYQVLYQQLDYFIYVINYIKCSLSKTWWSFYTYRVPGVLLLNPFTHMQHHLLLCFIKSQLLLDSSRH